MENIHIFPTDKPSRLVKFKDETNLLLGSLPSNKGQGYNIYITSDEEIKEGDWCILLENHYVNGGIGKYNTEKAIGYGLHNTEFFKKIILTTDQDLIQSGIQAIDDEFLEWFVNNPSCEEVIVTKGSYNLSPMEEMLEKEYVPKGTFDTYKIIIPKEEPKQERMYSEEDLREAFKSGRMVENYKGEWEETYSDEMTSSKYEDFNKWFEQFKKK